jgi:hypothetical protein
MRRSSSGAGMGSSDLVEGRGGAHRRPTPVKVLEG